MAEALTVKGIDALRPRAARYFVRDGYVRGLELRIDPDGARVWTLRYRVRGWQRRLRLGDYTRHGLGLADARVEAQRAMRKVDLGIDPQEERKAATRAATEARANTFAGIVTRYVESLKARGKREWKEMHRLLTTDVPKSWQKRPASSIQRHEVRDLLSARAKDAPIAANRLLEALRAAYNVAIKADVVTANPAALVDKPAKERKRERELTEDEIRTFWCGTETLDSTMRAFWRLRALTAQRLAEVRDMTWGELDLSAKVWRLSSTRTKSGREHLVPLNDTAVEILRRLRADVEARLQRRPKAKAPRYVLQGARGARQQREAAATLGVDGWRGHDLRRTSTTLMRRHGVPREHVAAVLNHAPRKDATSHYDLYDLLPEKVAALAVLDRELQRIIDGKLAGAVLPFARAQS